MDIKGAFYKLRLSLLMLGFAWVIRIAGLIDRKFAGRLAQTPFGFLMTSKDNGPARYFQCADGKLRSGRKPVPRDFGLIWRDSRSGGQAMIDMLMGKPKALYNAVVNGVLLLEGDGKMVAWFLETVNRLNRVFRAPKKTAAREMGRKDN